MIEKTNKARKVSKKKKSSWRKHVDTSDVNSFLESQRLEERLGVPFAERKDEDLFVVDIKPEQVETVSNTKRERRLALKNAEPRCLAVLNSRTAVPDPITKRNRVKTTEERKNPITRRLESERKRAGNLNLTEKIAKKNKKFADDERSKRPKRGDFRTDVWDQDKKVLPGIDGQWLTSDTVRHTLASKGMKKKRIPISVQRKPVDLPAVELPHPGTSYNPSYEDHQEYLRGIADQELLLMKEEAHLNRVTTKMFKKVSAERKEENWLKESSEGLPAATVPKNDEVEVKDEDDDGSTVKSVNPPVKNVKKTRVQRRKQKEQRKLALERKHAKVEKKKISDIYRLRLLNKRIAANDEKVAVLRVKRLKVKERKAVEPKTLSRVKFEPMEPVFKLGEELTGNLRNADPAGNLLKDRYKSLQQRSVVAPSKRVMKLNKARVKRFEKADHKMGWEGTFR